MIEEIAKQLNYFHWGTFLAAKLQFLVTVMIFIRVYGLPSYVTVLSLPVTFLILWLVGYIFVRSGLRDSYVKQEFGAVVKEMKKK